MWISFAFCASNSRSSSLWVIKGILRFLFVDQPKVSTANQVVNVLECDASDEQLFIGTFHVRLSMSAGMFDPIMDE